MNSTDVQIVMSCPVTLRMQALWNYTKKSIGSKKNRAKVTFPGSPRGSILIVSQKNEKTSAPKGHANPEKKREVTPLPRELGHGERDFSAKKNPQALTRKSRKEGSKEY